MRRILVLCAVTSAVEAKTSHCDRTGDCIIGVGTYAK
jgi:hypothetical protein